MVHFWTNLFTFDHVVLPLSDPKLSVQCSAIASEIMGEMALVTTRNPAPHHRITAANLKKVNTQIYINFKTVVASGCFA